MILLEAGPKIPVYKLNVKHTIYDVKWWLMVSRDQLRSCFYEG